MDFDDPESQSENEDQEQQNRPDLEQLIDPNLDPESATQAQVEQQEEPSLNVQSQDHQSKIMIMQGRGLRFDHRESTQ